MINGTYSIHMKTPMGVKKGELTLAAEDGVLSGMMKALGRETPIEPGQCSSDSFAFSGVLKTPVGALKYRCTGSVSGDSLTGTVSTQKGNFAIQGIRKNEH